MPEAAPEVAEAKAEEVMPEAAPEVAEAKVEEEKIPEATESKNAEIEKKLVEASVKIDIASKEAEAAKIQREKTDDKAEAEEKRRREEERRRKAREAARAKAIADERRAAMEYAESYRQRLREQRENSMSATKRRALEKKEEEKANELEARERELLIAKEKEREEAEARTKRVEELLSRIGDSVAATKEQESIEAQDVLEIKEEPKSIDEIKEPQLEIEKPADDLVIHIDSGIETNIIHIDGAEVGDIDFGAGKEKKPEAEVTAKPETVAPVAVPTPAAIPAAEKVETVAEKRAETVTPEVAPKAAEAKSEEELPSEIKIEIEAESFEAEPEIDLAAPIVIEAETDAVVVAPIKEEPKQKIVISTEEDYGDFDAKDENIVIKSAPVISKAVSQKEAAVRKTAADDVKMAELEAASGRSYEKKLKSQAKRLEAEELARTATEERIRSEIKARPEDKKEPISEESYLPKEYNVEAEYADVAPVQKSEKERLKKTKAAEADALLAAAAGLAAEKSLKKKSAGAVSQVTEAKEKIEEPQQTEAIQINIEPEYPDILPTTVEKAGDTDQRRDSDKKTASKKDKISKKEQQKADKEQKKAQKEAEAEALLAAAAAMPKGKPAVKQTGALPVAEKEVVQDKKLDKKADKKLDKKAKATPTASKEEKLVPIDYNVEAEYPDVYPDAVAVDGKGDKKAKGSRKGDLKGAYRDVDYKPSGTGEDETTSKKPKKKLSKKEQKRLEKEEAARRQKELEEAKRNKKKGKKGEAEAIAFEDSRYSAYDKDAERREMEELLLAEKRSQKGQRDLEEIRLEVESTPIDENIEKTIPRTRAEKKALTKKIKAQIVRDLELVDIRYESERRSLAFQNDMDAYRYSKASGKEEKKKAKNQDRLSAIKTTKKDAIEYEKLDNERYYMLVGMDTDRARLPKKTDRSELCAIRERLVELLDRRDRLNNKLIELYTGKDSDKKGGVAGADAAERKARQKEYNEQRRLVQLIMKRKISQNEKEKIFALLDMRIELVGTLAASRYRVKKDKLRGRAKKEQLKLQRSVKQQLKKNKHQIDKLVKRANVKSLKRTKANKQRIAGWIVLILLVGAGFAVWFFRAEIGALIGNLLTGLIR
jgi:hypothetical protein